MKYRIKDMGRGFDGLLVEGVSANAPNLIAVTKIFNDHVIFGDRNVSYPVNAYSLFVHRENLEEVKDEAREYDHKSPFGEVVNQYEMTSGELKVSVVKYTNAVSVTLHEKSRTLFSQNYFKKLKEVEDLVYGAFCTNDFEDLVFDLADLKTEETGANGT